MNPLPILFLLLLPTLVTAQITDTTSTEAAPPISMAALALHYYDIDWTDAQWDTLRGERLELFYLIDEIGEPFLQSVRGVDDPAILDSLAAATGRLSYFTPARRDGAIVESAWGFYFSFPDATKNRFATRQPVNLFTPQIIYKEELEQSYSFSRFSFVIDYNITFINHLGRPNQYFKPGGGIDMVFASRWSPNWGAGVGLGLEFNGQSDILPEDPFQRTGTRLIGVYMGGVLDRVLLLSENKELILRGEIGYGGLTFADDDDLPDDDFGFNGLHTGLLLHYSKPFKPIAFAGRDINGRVQASGFHYNIFGGVRFRYYGDRSATGPMLVLGAGIRIGTRRYEER